MRTIIICSTNDNNNKKPSFFVKEIWSRVLPCETEHRQRMRGHRTSSREAAKASNRWWRAKTPIERVFGSRGKGISKFASIRRNEMLKMCWQWHLKNDNVVNCMKILLKQIHFLNLTCRLVTSLLWKIVDMSNQVKTLWYLERSYCWQSICGIFLAILFYTAL